MAINKKRQLKKPKIDHSSSILDREKIFIFNEKAALKLLPSISTKDNKVRRGRGLLFAGSADFPGAGVLAARSALRMGCGYVTLAQFGTQISSLKNPDFLICDLNQKDWKQLQFNAVLVGPGFGVHQFTTNLIGELKTLGIKNVILDADALTVCARESLFPLPSSWIVTPHTGELSRCIGVSSELIDQDRAVYVRRAQDILGCVVLLKGHQTLVASATRIYKITSGNSALAKSGTGDVLAGIITALRARGLGPVKSAVLGGYLHGACADLWVKLGKDQLSMMASDVIEILPQVIFQLRNKKTAP
jgi:NAD(P)H-hydrate epimerase